ncbi:MAG: sigma-70 family RNA polymerase sigma factor [Myxococcales bacterium]|nr:sigma-70 family RNA polymerase sigma factor [Myxococcales bacterium]
MSTLAADSDECPAALDEPRNVSAGALRVREVVEQYYDFVWRSLRRLGVSGADAEDAAQEVFASVARRLSEVDDQHLRGFLYRTAMNHAAHAHRTRLRRREVAQEELEHEASGDPGPEQLLESARTKRLFYRVLDTLSFDLRAVFVLYELERFTMQEISELLELPPGTVASRLRRARAAFLSETRRATSELDGGRR